MLAGIRGTPCRYGSSRLSKRQSRSSLRPGSRHSDICVDCSSRSVGDRSSRTAGDRSKREAVAMRPPTAPTAPPTAARRAAPCPPAAAAPIAAPLPAPIRPPPIIRWTGSYGLAQAVNPRTSPAATMNGTSGLVIFCPAFYIASDREPPAPRKSHDKPVRARSDKAAVRQLCVI
jgi:hypothetical protein